MFDVITIGSATRDVFLKTKDFEVRKHSDSPTGIEQCFPLGSKIEVEELVFTTGGGGTNSAVTFARQGLKTACVGVIGNDFNGQEILRELKKEKITPIFYIHNDKPTAYSVILVTPGAERTILSFKGEGQHFDSDKIPWEELRASWFYLNSLGGNFDLLKKIIQEAKNQNASIAFNPGVKDINNGLEKFKQILKEIDIFILNKEEGELLLGLPFTANTDEILNNLNKLVKGITILTLGPAGSVVCDKKFIYRAGTPNSPKIERTGAGDAFGSGFVAQYIVFQGKSGDKDQKPEDRIIKSIQFATANASSVVSYYGPKMGILKKNSWGKWPLVEVGLSNLK